jgi:PAS domain S-box-containing protein
MRANTTNRSSLLALVIGLIATVGLIDAVTPLGYTPWPLYFVPLLLTSRFADPRAPWLCAGICSLLMILDCFVSPLGVGIEIAVWNRTAGVIALWLSAYLLSRYVSTKKILQTRDAQFRLFMDHVPGLAWVKECREDGTLALTYVNRRFEQTLLNGAPWHNTTDFDCWPRDMACALQENDRQVLNTRQPLQTVEAYSSDGTPHMMLVNTFLIPNESGPMRVGGIAVDVTDRINAESALRTSESRFRIVFEHAHVAMAILDEHQRLVSVNHAFCALTGYEEEELLGQTYTLFSHSEYVLTTGAVTDHLVEQTIPNYVYDTRHMTKHGDLKWLTVSVSLVPSLQSPSHGALAVIQDFTQRNSAETALRVSEERLRLAIESAALGPWERDLLSGRQTMSEECIRILGLPVGIDASSLEHVLASVHPEDRGRITDAAARASTTGTLAIEYRVLLPDGTVRWVFDQAKVFTQGAAAPTKMVGVVMDITDRKDAELALKESDARWQLAIQCSNDGMYDWDIPNARVSFSPRWMEMRGCTEGEVSNCLGEKSNRIHPDDAQRVIDRMRQYVAKEIPHYAEEYRVQRRDGTFVWIFDRGMAFWDEAGTPLRMVGAETDISALKTAEEERHRLFQEVQRARHRLELLSRQLLQAQEEERRAIARDLHDEIGQSLIALALNLSHVSHTLNGSGHPLLGDTIDTVNQLIAQVRTMALDLRPPLLEELGLSAALRWLTERQAQRGHMHIDFWVGSLPAALSPALAVSCYRIVQEALSNVTRHAHASGATVFLYCDDDALHLVIHDNGIGFEVEPALARSSRGGRMGLMSIQERAELLGGWTTIHSKPGEGTEIRVSFPLERIFVQDHSIEGVRP